MNQYLQSDIVAVAISAILSQQKAEQTIDSIKHNQLKSQLKELHKEYSSSRKSQISLFEKGEFLLEILRKINSVKLINPNEIMIKNIPINDQDWKMLQRVIEMTNERKIYTKIAKNQQLRWEQINEALSKESFTLINNLHTQIYSLNRTEIDSELENKLKQFKNTSQKLQNQISKLIKESKTKDVQIKKKQQRATYLGKNITQKQLHLGIMNSSAVNDKKAIIKLQKQIKESKTKEQQLLKEIQQKKLQIIRLSKQVDQQSRQKQNEEASIMKNQIKETQIQSSELKEQQRSFPQKQQLEHQIQQQKIQLKKSKEISGNLQRKLTQLSNQKEKLQNSIKHLQNQVSIKDEKIVQINLSKKELQQITKQFSQQLQKERKENKNTQNQLQSKEKIIKGLYLQLQQIQKQNKSILQQLQASINSPMKKNQDQPKKSIHKNEEEEQVNKAIVESLKSQIAQMIQNQNKQNALIKQKQQQNSTLLQKANDLSNKLKEVQTQQNNLLIYKEKCQKFKQQNTQLSHEINSFRQKLLTQTQIQKQLTNKINENDALQIQLQNEKQNSTKITEQLQKMTLQKERLTVHFQASQTKYNDQQSIKIKLSEEIAQLKEKIGKINHENQQNHSQSQIFNHSSLSKQLVQFSQIKENSKYIPIQANLRGKIQELQAKIIDLQQQLTKKLNQQKQSEENQATKSQHIQLVTATKKNQDLQRLNQQLTIKIAHLQGILQQKQEQITIQKQKLANIDQIKSDDRPKLLKKIKEYQEQIEQLSNQIKNLQELDTLKRQMEKDQEQYPEKDNKIKELQEQLKNKSSQLGLKQLQLKEMIQQRQRQKSSYQIRIKQLNQRANEYDRSTQLLFQNDVLQGQLEMKKFLRKTIEEHMRCEIIKSRLIYRFDPLNKVNFHKYVDQKENLVVIVKLMNGNYIAGYTEGCFEQGRPSDREGIIMNLTKRQIFHLAQRSRRAISYDEYYLIFGNSQIRLRSQQQVVFSNFGIANSYYNSRGKRVSDFLGGKADEREVEMQGYQIYQIQLEMD